MTELNRITALWFTDLYPWLRPLLTVTGSLLLGLLFHLVLFWIIVRIAARTETGADDLVAGHARGPMRWVILALFLNPALAVLRPDSPSRELLESVNGPLLIIAVAWLLVRLSYAFRELILDRFRTGPDNNLRARQVQTQVNFLQKIAIIIIIVVAAGTILMSFDTVRQLGTSLLASAGIVGIIFGFAAQRTLGTLFAGLQIAFTQPIRLDDTVVVEGESGRIEEITLTYVVVRLWDLRRLILPITHFIEKPFQNWTRVGSELLGTVYLYLDYAVPVAELRNELSRIVESDPNWDRQVAGLQVTDCKESAVELRALVSAASAAQVWDLRCAVREQLVAFIQRRYPESLPRLRAELVEGGGSGDRREDSGGQPSQLPRPE